MAIIVTLEVGMITTQVKVIPAADEESGGGGSIICVGTGEHPHDPAKINQVTRCPHCSREGGRDEFPDRGKVNADETVTRMDADALAAALHVDETVTHHLKMSVHSREAVDASTIPTGKVSYLDPQAADEAYPLLLEALKCRPDLALCCVYAPRSAPAMWRLGRRADILTLTQLAWPERVRVAPALKRADFDDRQLPLAIQFLDVLLTEFDPATYRDERALQVAAVVEAGTTSAAGAVAPAPVAAEGGLLLALQAAVEGMYDETKAAPKQPLPAVVPANVTVIKKARKAVAKAPATKPPAAKKLARTKKTA